jgi:hypothetical protein
MAKFCAKPELSVERENIATGTSRASRWSDTGAARQRSIPHCDEDLTPSRFARPARKLVS